LTALDVSSNTALAFLDCKSNQLTSLDVSTNTALEELRCHNNQLTYLNMRNGVTDSLTTFNATNNPNLTCIETLDPDYATTNWTNANSNIDEGVTFSVICGSEDQDVWYVATTGSDGGAGTQESPFATIQTGINAAGNGNTVQVAAGTYMENIDFNKKNIAVISELGSYSTTIDGMESGSVAIMDSTSNAELIGFHLTNGDASAGGGVKCTAGTIQLEDLVISGNQAAYGSGIIGTVQSQITADHLLIYNNSNAQGMSGIAGLYFRDGSSISFNHSTVVNDFSMEIDAGNSIKFFGETSLELNNTVLWNLGGGNVIYSANGWGENTLNVSYSDVDGGVDSILQTDGEAIINWGEGNIDADPLFCEPDSGNYHIAGNSPSSGTGEDGADMGALGVGCDEIWLPPTIAAIEDTSMDEDSELMLQLSAESEQGYDIYFEAESDTSSVYVYTEDDMLHINLETNWNGSSQITVMAYSDFDDEINNTTSFTLTVNPVNDDPMFHNLHALVGAGIEFHVPIHVFDIDMDSLVVSLDDAWDYPGWLSLADNPYALTGTATESANIHFPLHVNDGQSTVTDTFHLSAQFFNPRITSVTDVPEDQGGRVYVSFLRSFFDHPNESNQMYTVFRHDMVDNAPDWIVVGSGAAIGDGSYTYEVATLRDSTFEGDGITEFKVVASMDEGHFHSLPVSGYSVDNIAPGVPQGLMAVLVDDGIQLTWEMSADEDFQYYMLEKSSDEAFTEPEVFEMIDIAYLDLDYVLNESNYYRIAAVDHAGNISDYSDVVDFAVLATDLDLIPEVFALHQNYPNPFNPTTQIKYDLPEDALVTINIYDVMGRSIKSLVNSNQPAGYRSIQWNATNNLGEGVSAGMYIYTIQAGEFRQTKKMVLLK
jgi:hypothetical protein